MFFSHRRHLTSSLSAVVLTTSAAVSPIATGNCCFHLLLSPSCHLHFTTRAGKGGELTHDETTIISGALDLTDKTAEEAMTPIESTFSLDVNSKLDWEAMGKILARGHSRVPVYSGNPRNIIGLLLVKSLLTVRAETETPVSAVSIRRIPRVPADMPLYDILNEFQKGSSHMAAVATLPIYINLSKLSINYIFVSGYTCFLNI